MNEQEMQDRLYWWLQSKGREFIVPNVKVYGYEADLVSLTTSLYDYEIEIKCSRADLLRDTKTKKRKHRKLAQGVNWCPSGFSYACAPQVEVSTSDIPDYAGLIVVTETGNVVVRRKPPRINSKKMSRKDRRYLARGLQWRYWERR